MAITRNTPIRERRYLEVSMPHGSFSYCWDDDCAIKRFEGDLKRKGDTMRVLLEADGQWHNATWVDPVDELKASVVKLTGPALSQCRVCGLVMTNGATLCLYCAATMMDAEKAAELKLARGMQNASKSELDAPSQDSDPHGIDQHAPGAKLDAEKPRMGLVMDGFALALLKVGEIGTYGAKKYSDNGWQSVPNGEARYKDALLRHLLLASQEELDPESAMLHLSHACWNCLAALQLHLEKKRS